MTCAFLRPTTSWRTTAARVAAAVFVLAMIGLTLMGRATAAPGRQPTTRPAPPPAVFKAKVVPHWLDRSHFWYRNQLRGGAWEFVLVDAGAGVRSPAFDADRLALALSAATGKRYAADRLPVTILARDAHAVTVAVRDVAWRCDLDTYHLSPARRDVAPATGPAWLPAPTARAGHPDWSGPVPSPDGKRTAVLRDGNIFVRSKAAAEKQLTADGHRGCAYDRFFWSPDGRTIVAFRVEPGDHKVIYRLESSPRGTGRASGGGAGRAILHTDEYPLPGDKLDSFELNVFDVGLGRQIKPDVERIDASGDGGHPSPTIRWRPDGRHFLYEKHDRGHRRLRLIEVDAATGDARTVLDERSSTFIWTAHIEALHLHVLNYLANGREVIYVSERSGWRHLYLLDLDRGTLQPMTSGEWVIRGVYRIDEETRQVWFAASGVYPGQDPYLVHYGRVNFDRSGLTWLTDANGNHEIDFEHPSANFAPDGKYLVVTHSRVDLPPVTELRRVADGRRILTLERADAGDGWKPSTEVFTAKGRDGTTDIWGIICRPADFDPAKKYPVLEDVYAGPQGAHTPKSFRARPFYGDLTSLGFIVVKAEGMGTALRSKAFHDVCWHNLADAGFPDRIKWMQAASAKYPHMDLTRVGIFGTSAGGQAAAGALIFHPDFYKVAVANCGCHDNRMDKISWNEQWMGYPIGPQYSACSNIDNAARLKGRLQLVLGEMDGNVPVESTYRFVNALVQAGKEFEFVLIPGAGHGARSPITRRKLQDFFVRYLQGVEPPSPN
jgi:dipeptidyl aminopeptidase/acylaminoacyl peptidase